MLRIIIVILVVAASTHHTEGQRANYFTGASISESNEKQLQRNRTPVAVNLQLSGTCSEPGAETVQLQDPLVSMLNSSSRDAPALLALLQRDNSVSVKKIAGPLFVVRGPEFSSNLLNVRIHSLDLTHIQQFSPEEAIGAIKRSPEVVAEEHKLDMRPVLQLGRLGGIFDDSHKHLNKSLRDVTVEDAFNLILSRFRGVLVYTECTRPTGGKLFDTTYYPPSSPSESLSNN